MAVLDAGVEVAFAIIMFLLVEHGDGLLGPIGPLAICKSCFVNYLVNILLM